jgi:hypothetical protein
MIYCIGSRCRRVAVLIVRYLIRQQDVAKWCRQREKVASREKIRWWKTSFTEVADCSLGKTYGLSTDRVQY